MSNNDFLREVLRAHEIQPNSPEMRALQDARKEVEALLRDAFPDCSPTIRYGGSKAKGTMVLEIMTWILFAIFLATRIAREKPSNKYISTSERRSTRNIGLSKRQPRFV